MEDEQIISIISILKSLRKLESIQGVDKLYIETGEVAKNFKIKRGVEINFRNKDFPYRYLLLKNLSKDKYVVSVLGDIPNYNINKCLGYYRINNKLLDIYSQFIFDLINSVSNWLEVTGNEFFVDTKMFKVRNNNIL
jgi:hypothetical protein